MTRYIWHAGEWLPAGHYIPQPRLYIISDHMPPARHMATGEIFESKSAFRAATRAAGCVELGNDAPVAAPPQRIDRAELRADITTSIQQLEQGRPAPSPAEATGTIRRY